MLMRLSTGCTAALSSAVSSTKTRGMMLAIEVLERITPLMPAGVLPFQPGPTSR